MPDISSSASTRASDRTRWLTLCAVLTTLLAAVGLVTSVTADAAVTANPHAVTAQATSPVGQTTGPRLQPVGNGDTIASPVEATDEANSSDSSWWWRVVFGAAVVVVVLVALVQRRGTPDSARRTGSRSGPGRRGNDRNALGH